MTAIYRTEGRLTEPVNDLTAARAYLDEPMEQYIGSHHPDLAELVALCRWDLTDESTWFVQVVATRPLDVDELARLSDWICGQNSDGLGEGFEQQPFAEHGEYDAYGNFDDDTYEMSSFDWGSNKCALRSMTRPEFERGRSI